MITKPSDGRSAKWHISLDDGTTEIGFKTCDRRGNPDPRGVVSNPYPQYASQLRQGRSRHADRVPPFTDIALSDFSGGRGELHFDVDNSRYWDGKRMDTRREGRVLLGPQETYIKGIRNFDENWSKSTEWTTLQSAGTTSITQSFTSSAAYNANSVVVVLRKVGSPTGDVQVELLSSADVQLKTKSLTIGTDLLTDYVSERVEFEFASVQALTDATAYKVKITYSGGDASNYVKVGVDSTDALLYRVLDDTGDFGVKLFEYKGAMYAVTVPNDGSVSKLYLNGDRGACDSNTGALTKVNDASKSWTSDEWIGDIVYILSGPGLKEEQRWREITDNDGTSLTVSPTWTVEHDTDTEYVILSDSWELKQTLSARVTDVEVILDKVYFGFGHPGGDTNLYPRRYQAYNADGTWTERINMEDNYTSGSYKITSLPSAVTPEMNVNTIADYYSIGAASRASYVDRYSIPRYWQDMYKVIGLVAPGDRMWASTIYSNVVPDLLYSGPKMTIADAFTTGKFAHLELESPIDLTFGEALTFNLLVSQGVAGEYETAGDLQIVIADAAGIEESYNLDGTVGTAYNELIFLDTPGTSSIDQTNITDVYFSVASDEGDFRFYLSGGVYLTGDRGRPYDRWRYFEPNERINNLIVYAGGAGEISLKPWIISDRGLYYIERDVLREVPLREFAEFRDARTGEGVCVGDVYLYFNVGETIQRYYSGQLDNIGPDAGYGLPENRRGIPASLASYPGHIFAGIDAGSDGYSSILTRRNHGWHEMYRGPETDKRIRDINIQAREDSADRLWFAEGADIAYIPLSINPETETDYEYNFEGVIETGRIYGGGLRETDKYFDAIDLITEDLDANTTIEVDYKTSDSTTWTELGTTVNSSPRQQVDLPDNTTGRWIQLRFRVYTEDNSVSPVLVSAVLNALERFQHKDTFVYTVRLDSGAERSFTGQEDSNDGYAKWTQLKTWMNGAEKLTLYSVSEFEHDSDVFIEPSQTRVVYHHWDDVSNNEVRVVQLTLIEK